MGSLNFGGIAVDSSSPAQAVRLTNTGNIALAISAISTSGNFSATQNCGSGLSAGGVCTVDVVFTPATSGLLTGTLSITTALRAYSVDLSGTGQQAVTTVSPATLSFASQALATTSNAQIVTVTNAGSAPAALATPTVTGSFTVASTTCGTTLSAGASCTYSVTASPTVTGSSSGTLGVSTSVGTQTVTLTASGYATIVASGSTRIWSDGTMATSCYGYLNASGNYSYSGATGNGVYTITPGGGTPQPVYCDMTNDGGGWTLVMRGYGGSYYTDAYWNTTAALNLAYASTPNAPSGTTTFKLADGTINAIRAAGTGNYRTQSDGTYSYKRFWQSGTYGHTSVPPASAQETVSYATLGWVGLAPMRPTRDGWQIQQAFRQPYMVEGCLTSRALHLILAFIWTQTGELMWAGLTVQEMRVVPTTVLVLRLTATSICGCGRSKSGFSLVQTYWALRQLSGG